MSAIDFAEISSVVESLTSSDKLRLMRVLVDSLAKDDAENPPSDANYPVWSTIEAHQGAAALMRFIESQQVQ